MIRRRSGFVQWLATGRGGNSFLQEEFHSIWTHFWLWKLGEAGAARIQQVEASDAAKRPMIAHPTTDSNSLWPRIIQQRSIHSEVSAVPRLRNSGLVLGLGNALGKKCSLICELKDAGSSECWGIGI